jgi:hypothetical protein
MKIKQKLLKKKLSVRRWKKRQPRNLEILTLKWKLNEKNKKKIEQKCRLNLKQNLNSLTKRYKLRKMMRRHKKKPKNVKPR